MRRKRRKRYGRIRRRRGFRGTRFKNASRSGSRVTQNPQRRATTNTAIGLRMRRSLFALVVRDDDASVVVYLSTLRRSNPFILVHFSPPKCILWYVSFRFCSVFFFLNAEQRERTREKQPTATLCCCCRCCCCCCCCCLNYCTWKGEFSNSLTKMPIRTRESNLEENVSNSLSLTLSYSVSIKLSLSLSCFFLSLLSRAREKNYSF